MEGHMTEAKPGVDPEIHMFGEWEKEAKPTPTTQMQEKFKAWLSRKFNNTCQICDESELFCDTCKVGAFEKFTRQEFLNQEKYRRKFRDCAANVEKSLIATAGQLSPEVDQPVAPELRKRAAAAVSEIIDEYGDDPYQLSAGDIPRIVAIILKHLTTGGLHETGRKMGRYEATSAAAQLVRDIMDMSAMELTE
jgi:hypothetical protein